MKTNQQFYCIRFYVTYRCNSRCGYCNVWQDGRFRNQVELAPEEAENLIRQCYDMGVRYADFTGGEPTLNKNLPRLIKYAKGLGIKTEVTSNAAMGWTEALMTAAETADKFNISLDTLKKSKYNKIRGIDCFERVVSAVDRTLKIRPPKLMMAVSEDNADEMDEMIRYAQEKGAEIYLNPVFSYFDSEEPVAPVDIISQIQSKIFDRGTVVLLHFLEFIRAGGTGYRPPCSANRRTLTFGPNGDLILPCYHAIAGTIPWSGCLKDMLASEAFRKYAENSGQLACCKGCAVVPYFGISFGYSLDAWFLIQSYSEKLHHLKRDFLNQIPELGPPAPALEHQLAELLEITRSLTLPEKDGAGWLYRAERRGENVYTKIYSKPLTPAQYRSERGAEDCWQLKLVPHNGFDRVCADVYRKAYGLYREGDTGDEILRIFRGAMEFQLRWWKFYISRNMRVSQKCDMETEQRWLRDYLGFLCGWARENAFTAAEETVETLLTGI